MFVKGKEQLENCIHFIIDVNDPGLFFPYQGSA